MKRLALLLTAALAGCAGTVPQRNAPPEQAIAAILIGTRFILPTGETRGGRTVVNFESEGGRQAEVYRLPVGGGENFLYLVEPGVYRVMPTRSLFGFHQTTMKAVIDGRSYRIPFPRELLRLPAYDVKPSRILPMGILEYKVQAALPGQASRISVRRDQTIGARRKIVQDTGPEMMGPPR
ncbi:MAG: hypothetical protein SF051_08600, partial [Elusimicrobiota bacterium]|nr:hypothetical protein [Elusimicrobiota bacterium]